MHLCATTESSECIKMRIGGVLCFLWRNGDCQASTLGLGSKQHSNLRRSTRLLLKDSYRYVVLVMSRVGESVGPRGGGVNYWNGTSSLCYLFTTSHHPRAHILRLGTMHTCMGVFTWGDPQIHTCVVKVRLTHTGNSTHACLLTWDCALQVANSGDFVVNLTNQDISLRILALESGRLPLI